MGRCTHAFHRYRGPLIAVAIGVGFMVVGAVPVAVTYAIDAQGSATIIGVGFVGFGLLVVLPGVVWCLVRRAATLRCCRSQGDRLRRPDDEAVADDDAAGGGASAATTTMTSDRQLSNTSARQSAPLTTRCFILTDAHFYGDKSAESVIFFDGQSVTGDASVAEDGASGTNSADDVDVEARVTSSSGTQRGDGYVQLPR